MGGVPPKVALRFPCKVAVRGLRPDVMVQGEGYLVWVPLAPRRRLSLGRVDGHQKRIDPPLEQSRWESK